jgi:hypothetical protein
LIIPTLTTMFPKMMGNSTNQPKQYDLLRGILLGTIVEAIFVIQNPGAGGQWWEGTRYHVDNEQGAWGEIAFADDGLVGVFFDPDSPRNPRKPGGQRDTAWHFSGMPSVLRRIADEMVRQHFLVEQLSAVPLITAAFWSDSEHLLAAERWDQVLLNGGHLVRTHLLGVDEMLAAWQSDYGFTGSQIELARSILTRRLTSDGWITLSPEERQQLVAQGSLGIEECRRQMASIHVSVGDMTQRLEEKDAVQPWSVIRRLFTCSED